MNIDEKLKELEGVDQVEDLYTAISKRFHAEKKEKIYKDADLVED